MADRYVFRFTCADFEVELVGDVHWVEKQLSRFERSIAGKLGEIPWIAKQEPAEQKQELGPALKPAPARPQPVPEETRAEQPRRRSHRSRRSRRKKNKAHAENGRGETTIADSPPALQNMLAPPPAATGVSDPPAPPLAEPEFHAEERAEDIPQSPIPREGNFVHPPLEPPSPPAAEFPLRRRAPKINKETLAPLLEKYSPRTQHERIMLFGYYMETEGRGSDFTAAEIKKCYKVLGQEPLNSIPQVLTHAARSGFLLKKETGRLTRHKLSAKGRRYVENGLRLD